MAVVVQCYHCSTILELDDGFRGGVCRCAQCGSLLQVPKASGRETRQARPAAPDAVETRPQRPERPGSPEDGAQSSGSSLRDRSPMTSRPGRPATPTAGNRSNGAVGSPLEEAARAASVAASSSSGLQRAAASPLVERSAAVRAPGPIKLKPKARAKSNRVVIISVVALIVLVLAIGGVVLWAMLRNNPVTASSPAHGDASTGTPADNKSGGGTADNPNVAGTPTAGGDTAATPAVPSDIETIKPNFLGIPLVGKQIVVSIDCANSSQDFLSFAIEAASRSMVTLTPDQHILIALWGDKGITTVPADGKFVTRSDAGQMREKLQDVGLNGSSDPVVSIAQSLQLGGDQTILVSAKFGLTSDLVPQVLAAKKVGQRIDTIKIENPDPDNPFATIAAKSDGHFLQLDMDKIQSMVPPQ